MTALTPEQAARAVKLLEEVHNGTGNFTWGVRCAALFREIEPAPDPVAVLEPAINAAIYRAATGPEAQKLALAWSAIKQSLSSTEASAKADAAPALDEAAIRDDEARLCARWCHNRYAAIKAASVHGGVEDDSDIISRAGILDGIAEVERAVARGEHRPQPDRGAS